MEKIGVVCEIDGEYATVKVQRDSSCGENCAACGLCGNKEMLLKIKNSEQLVVGDEVKLKSSDAKFLKRSAFGYLSLTALLICGGLIGSMFGGEWVAFWGSIFALVLGVLLLKRFFVKDMEVTVEKITR